MTVSEEPSRMSAGVPDEMTKGSRFPDAFRWAVYRRRSTEEHQAESLDVQLANARRFAERMGGTLADHHVFTDDAVSRAEFKKRPGLLAMLNAAQRGDFDAIVLRDETRLGGDMHRTSLVIDDIRTADVRLFYYATGEEVEYETAVDKFMVAARNFASELEREKTAQRTREHLELKARQGLNVGGRVYGYDNIEVVDPLGRRQVQYRVNIDQAETIREIFRRYAAGEGLRTITKDLNARRVAPPTVGKRGSGYWAHTGIWPMLRRERYLGTLVWGREGKAYRGGTQVRVERASNDRVVVKSPDLQIVDEAAWNAVQERIGRTKKRGGGVSRVGRESKYLLTSYARCGVCGGPMRATTGRDGKRSIRVYACGRRKDCGDTVCTNSLRKPVDHVDGLVIDWIRTKVLREEIVVQVLRELRARLADRAKSTDAETPAIEEQVGKLKGEIANLTAAIAVGGAGTPQALVQAVREREEAVAALVARLRALRVAPEVISLETRRMEREARARLTDFRGLLDRNRDGARKVLDALLETPLKFTPTPDNHYVIEGPVYLGGLYPITSDPSGIRTRVRGLKGHCPGPG